ncbi:ferric reductase-like transmembrane domain-containing protein [Subtercola vilae]|uniref:ferredoxin reductase family protein n=1 Tax=Subtercola vilae TaxID=2056433 RepID=UPI0010A9FE62|nr:ferredoxin reductase family protein [Subtercola vilae]
MTRPLGPRPRTRTRIRADHLVLTALVGGGVLSLSLAVLSAPTPLMLTLALAAHVFGLLAGYFVAVMLVLMSRAPLLEREIGADRLARWHGRLGRVFVATMIVHVVAATATWIALRHDTIIGGALNLMSLPWLWPALAATVLFVAVGALSIRAARRRLSYERWHSIHLLTYVAIALSFGHELAGPNLAGFLPAEVFWSLLYVYAFALVLRYRVLRPLEQTWRHRLRVETVLSEAPGVVSIVFRGHYVDDLHAVPGQFFRWRFLTRRTWLSAHPFSLSAPAQNNRLRITVKDLGSGSRLLHSITPGTLVLAEGPYGAMTSRRRTRPDVLLVAGGVGITPMRALFETLDADSGAITLLYRASTVDDIVFRDELEEIAAHRGVEIVWMIGRSSDPANRFSAERLTELIPNVRTRDVYLCASPALSDAARTALLATGLPRRHLHEEVFSF